ncbi:MAG: nicotinate phosphoribosyltransferase [Erysipelotrichaceae bacterium]|nr:nicotinate phosphoribosyltransferase [Erysipelotrichaceae bacterium]
MEQIIKSLLENDLYKFSMGQAIYHQFSDYKTTWSFKCRNENVRFSEEMVEEIRNQIRMFCTLRFTEDELEYLNNIRWIKGSYVDFLRLWQPRYEDYLIERTDEGQLIVETSGTWLNTSLYEVPTLAIINEVYFRMNYDYDKLIAEFKTKAKEKCEKIADGTYKLASFSEFGLRRRLSSEAQEYIVQELKNYSNEETRYVGTSNVYLAKKYHLTPVGTMAHEWVMCVGQGDHKHNPAYSNYYALNAWVREYSVLNGTALTDTITTDCFLKDFQLTFATLFSGVRHDSGDPITWGDVILAHYERLGVDAREKTLLFSDSLNFDKATKIYEHFKGKCKVAFGIGTYLSNDTCVDPLNIVMKVTKCNGQDVAKISDVEGKSMCKNQEYVDYLARSIDWRMRNEVVK